MQVVMLWRTEQSLKKEIVDRTSKQEHIRYTYTDILQDRIVTLRDKIISLNIEADKLLRKDTCGK